MENYLLQFMPYLDRYLPPEYEKDLTDVLFDTKLRLIKSKLEMIMSKVEERATLKNKHQTGILYDEITVNNLMMSLPDRFTPYCPPSEQTLQLEQQKLRLNQERRAENSKAWSDVLNLYTESIDTYLQLKKQENKREMMMDNL
jgi:hypothetical protein